MKIFLDDERPTPEGWFGVATASEAIMAMQTENVTDLSLDHDLGIEETGYDVLLWIEEQVATNNYVPPTITIHTANSSARVKMELAVIQIYKLAFKNIKWWKRLWFLLIRR